MYLLYNCVMSEKCIFCIIVEGVRAVYVIIVEGVMVVFTVL